MADGGELTRVESFPADPINNDEILLDGVVYRRTNDDWEPRAPALASPRRAGLMSTRDKRKLAGLISSVSLNVKDPPFNAKGDDVTDDTTALQAALDAASTFGQPNFGDGRLSEVLIPPGKYRTSAPIGWTTVGDGGPNVKIVGVGSGTSICQIRAFDASHPVLEFKTDLDGNLRRITVENLTLRGGSIGINTYRMKYCQFRDIRFFQQGELALRVEQGGMNRFDALNITETTNDSMELVGGFGDMFADILVGEFAGNILVDGCLASFVGGKMFGAWDRRTPGGYQGMGPALFTVKGGGSLQATGVDITPYENLVNAQNHRSVRFDNCPIRWDGNASHDGHLFKIDSNSRRGALNMRGCQIDLWRGAPFSTLDVYSTTRAGEVHDSTFAGNQIRVATGNTARFVDDLLDPSKGNLVYGNTVVEGGTV